MKKILLGILLLQCISSVNALVINEIMSNPVGDDGGREWIEVYNDSNESIDIATLSISIKGGGYISVTPLQGGTVLPKGGYAIISSVVSGNSKFLLDYPTYTGLLFKSSISLVNSGVTSIDIKVQGTLLDSLSSYTAAKEGSTLGRSNGSFVTTTPTPGVENQSQSQDTNSQQVNASTTENQATIAQAVPPSPDIVLYMPTEKIVVAGVPTTFSVFSLTKGGKHIDNVTYTWAYGDGGQGSGSTTVYTFAYPGRYVVTVEGGNSYLTGTGRMMVRVVVPEISIAKIDTGKYGAYIDIVNPNNYELDVSQWKLSIDGSMFPFPKNTVLLGNSTTHVVGNAMGFASTTIASSTLVRILFPTMEEVTRFYQTENSFTSITSQQKQSAVLKKVAVATFVATQKKAYAKSGTSSTSTYNVNAIDKGVFIKKEQQKDTRMVSFFKSIFKN